MLLYGYSEPATEVVKTSIQGTQIGTLGDGTQIWKITHNGVDVHTVHWHMYDVQLINRVAWDNNIRMPDANELGWKETVRVNPLQDTIVALRPIIPNIPFDIPNSVRLIDPTKPEGEILKDTFDPTGQGVTLTNHMVNFGWEYVWHCHILAHEEMDMMRTVSVAVPPRPPTSATATSVPTGVQVTWADNSLSETNFKIERAGNAGFTSGLVSFTVNSGVTSYIDTTAIAGQTYYYRVKAINIVGDAFDYTISNPQAAGFETMTAESTPSNLASTQTGTFSLQNSISWYTMGDTNSTAVAVGDVNGDGVNDIVSAGYYSDGINRNGQLIVRNSETMAVQSSTVWRLGSITNVNAVAIGDVDTDSQVEIVTAGSYFDGTNWIGQLIVWNGLTLASERMSNFRLGQSLTIDALAIADVSGAAGLEILTGSTIYDGVNHMGHLAIWSGTNLALHMSHL
jgi:hypothetical protein